MRRCNSLLSAELYLMQIDQYLLLTEEEKFDLAVGYRENNDREAAGELIS
jgi:hypothetical protein